MYYIQGIGHELSETRCNLQLLHFFARRICFYTVVPVKINFKSTMVIQVSFKNKVNIFCTKRETENTSCRKQDQSYWILSLLNGYAFKSWPPATSF